LATNLSRALQAWTAEVLLLDMDPQQSAQEWAARNPENYPGVIGVQVGYENRLDRNWTVEYFCLQACREDENG